LRAESHTTAREQTLNIQPKSVGVIPARFASSRLPGKPLLKIGSKPMIQWVYERSSRSSLLSEVWVATDDSRIYDAVQSFGGHVKMTSASCASGTDRIAETIQDLEADIVINIQGDEPFIYPENIDRVVGLLKNNPESVMATLMRRIDHPDDLFSPDVTKVIVNLSGEAIYFSRHPIPCCRDCEISNDWLERHAYYRHIGLYGYRSGFLQEMSAWGPSALETMEKLEQLRVIEHGYPIQIAETDLSSVSVDTQQDLEQANRIYTAFE
jgi:3-deoxy-manno-octulosonate cytidylyltransferase (CMP-KDO synthetase)